uniref:Tetraspanin n=2 Tax=Rhizochromulina marina TaxID=1034831 RepID=A0A7S2W8E5_9STRA|mmetsp:Transcript_17384/g.50760  ORF Transcript_17384/g.50760 Transcript_17384/m.50760 type:complete len:338 (+) Transcript_17384:200-1213(+)|eukprot:CAMPEP_0118997678 /NCGR_PEP_ID=MMETSP1173-20130426/62169_1 /TAXON_ID=1034831 /ORGANISM="Rhizochromulina marina cf, Strain CCMP1243" /LENGTH=337 /DNA_ID=CAMNT_0006949137 /DNA_START=101 /DNA_END=1114 /DNA_ORIENTATION=+
MCLPKNIKLLMMILNGFKAISFLLFIVFGAMISSNEDFQRAYGTEISSLAGGIITLAFFVPVSTFLGYKGTKMHNKFLLLVHALLEGFLLVVQLSLALALIGYAQPETSIDIRKDCSRTYPVMNSREDCQSWFESDRYAGFKLVWAYNFEMAMIDQAYFSYLTAFQIEGKCCGFSAPLNCEDDERSYPEGLLTEGVKGYWLDQRTTCGRERTWYQPSGQDGSECNQPVDPNAVVPRYGGCRYEMPIGDCLNDVPLIDTLGCASYVEEQINGELIMQAGVVAFLTLFEFISMIAACCYCMKRKEEDRLPPYLIQVPIHPAVATAITAPQKTGSGSGKV